MCLLKKIKSDNLHHVNHSIVTTDLLQLVQIVQDRMLRMVNLKHLRVCHKQGPHQILGWYHALIAWSLLQHIVTSEAKHIKRLKG